MFFKSSKHKSQKKSQSLWSKAQSSAQWLLSQVVMAGVAAVMLWCSQYVFFCAVMAVMISQPLMVNWANNLHRKRTKYGKVDRTDVFSVVDKSVMYEWLQRCVAFSTYICITPITRALVMMMPIAALARIPLILTIGMQTWMTHYARENITKKDNALVTDGSFGFTRRMTMLMFVMPLIQTMALYAKELELTASIISFFPGFSILTGSWVFYLGVSLAFYGAVQLMQSALFTAAFAASSSTPSNADLKWVQDSETTYNIKDGAIKALSKLSKLEALYISAAAQPTPEKAAEISRLNALDKKEVHIKKVKDAECDQKFSETNGVTAKVVSNMQVDLQKDKDNTAQIRSDILSGRLNDPDQVQVALTGR